MRKTSLKEARRKLRKRIRRYLAFLITFLFLYTLLIVFDVKLFVSTGEPLTYSLSYDMLVVNVTFYKIYVPPVPQGTWYPEPAPTKEVNVTLVIGNHSIWFGFFDWSGEDTGIIPVNVSKTVILEPGRKYTVYFVDSVTGYSAPIAIVDEYYRRSFDALIQLPQFQLHFVFYVYKCGSKIRIENQYGIEKLIVKGYDELKNVWETRTYTCGSICNVNLSECYVDIEVEFINEIIPGLYLAIDGNGNQYLLLSHSYIVHGVVFAGLITPLTLMYKRYADLKKGGRIG